MRLFRNIVVVFCFLAMGMLAFVVAPISALIYEGERPVFLPLNVPFVDVDSDFGYYANFVYHAQAFFTTGPAVYGLESFLTIILSHIQTSTDITILAMEESSDAKNLDSLEATRSFRNILLQIQDIDK